MLGKKRAIGKGSLSVQGSLVRPLPDIAFWRPACSRGTLLKNGPAPASFASTDMAELRRDVPTESQEQEPERSTISILEAKSPCLDTVLWRWKDSRVPESRECSSVSEESPASTTWRARPFHSADAASVGAAGQINLSAVPSASHGFRHLDYPRASPVWGRRHWAN